MAKNKHPIGEGNKFNSPTAEEMYEFAYKSYDPSKPDPKFKEIFFGDYIREKREAKGWLLKDAAEKYGIGSPYLSDIEKRKQKSPSRQTVIRIATALGMNLKQTNYLCSLADNEHRGLGKDKVAFMRKHQFVGIFVRMLMQLEEDFELEGKPAELAEKYIKDIAEHGIMQVEDIMGKECPHLYGDNPDDND